MINTKNFFKKIIFNIINVINFEIPFFTYQKLFRIPIINSLGIPLFFNKEQELLKIFSKTSLLKNGIAIDVGANIGQTLLKLISANYGQIICFEPDPRCCNYLHKLSKSNNFFKQKRVSIVCTALTSKEIEILKIKTSSEKPVQSASAAEDIRDYSTYDFEYTCIATCLDNYLNSTNESRKISLIKIDVEGLELDVLNGAIKTIKNNFPFILFESLPIGSKGGSKYRILKKKSKLLLQFFNNINYKVFRITKNSNLELVKDLSINKSYRYMQYLAMTNKDAQDYLRKDKSQKLNSFFM